MSWCFMMVSTKTPLAGIVGGPITTVAVCEKAGKSAYAWTPAIYNIVSWRGGASSSMEGILHGTAESMNKTALVNRSGTEPR